ncbi:hypothetical protein BT93_L0118 [Corymbia citriodora subsp. variegata]|uniref:Uncharacterized protein n=1 Tax=Corymbia citriodora subsp. variegata TaxID=360336 RepID=A0A8T0CJC1_CORYI|nr:hypothetical protein BT93_L0118 [Corymbia citriodora subsp. variegata]
MADDEHHGDAYHPKDALGAAIKGGLITTGAGALVSAIQNTLTKQNVGAMSIFTRTGSTIAVFGAMGGVFEFTKIASANLRQKDDSYNHGIGGFFAGTMLGLRFRTAPAVMGYGTALAVIMTAFNYTGGRLVGYSKDPSVDEVARKEYLRKNRRRPLEDTVRELGEGRGIYAPGYTETRAERIKDAYGYDVPAPVSAAP